MWLKTFFTVYLFTLTLLMETRWKLLSLLKVWPRQHFQHLLNAPPARSSQNLSKPHTERSVTTVHVGDIVGVLAKKRKKKKRWTISREWIVWPNIHHDVYLLTLTNPFSLKATEQFNDFIMLNFLLFVGSILACDNTSAGYEFIFALSCLKYFQTNTVHSACFRYRCLHTDSDFLEYF